MLKKLLIPLLCALASVAVLWKITGSAENTARQRYTEKAVQFKEGVLAETFTPVDAVTPRILGEMVNKNVDPLGNVALTAPQKAELVKSLQLFLKAYAQSDYETYAVFRYGNKPNEGTLGDIFLDELRNPYTSFGLPTDLALQAAQRITGTTNPASMSIDQLLRLHYELKKQTAISSKTLTCSNCVEALNISSIQVRAMRQVSEFLSCETMLEHSRGFGSFLIQHQPYVLKPSTEDILHEKGELVSAWVYIMLRSREAQNPIPIIVNFYWVPAQSVWSPVEIARSNSSYPITFLF